MRPFQKLFPRHQWRTHLQVAHVSFTKALPPPFTPPFPWHSCRLASKRVHRLPVPLPAKPSQPAVDSRPRDTRKSSVLNKSSYKEHLMSLSLLWSGQCPWVHETTFCQCVPTNSFTGPMLETSSCARTPVQFPNLHFLLQPLDQLRLSGTARRGMRWSRGPGGSRTQKRWSCHCKASHTNTLSTARVLVKRMVTAAPIPDWKTLMTLHGPKVQQCLALPKLLELRARLPLIPISWVLANFTRSWGMALWQTVWLSTADTIRQDYARGSKKQPWSED